MKSILLILSFIASLGASAQRLYTELDVIADTRPDRINQAEISETYSLNGYKIMIGWEPNAPEIAKPYFFVKDANGRLLFEYQSTIPAKKYDAAFFKSNNPSDPFLVLVESVSTDGSYGSSIFSLTGQTVKYLGELDVSVTDNMKTTNLRDIVPYLQIRSEGEKLFFNFNAPYVIVHPGQDSEKNFAGPYVRYIYENGSLKLSTDMGLFRQVPVNYKLNTKYPDRFLVSGTVTDYEIGPNCDVTCGSGTLKIKVENSVMYKSEFLYLIVPCFIGNDGLIGTRLRLMVRQFSDQEEYCYFDVIGNKFETPLPFYIADERKLGEDISDTWILK